MVIILLISRSAVLSFMIRNILYGSVTEIVTDNILYFIILFIILNILLDFCYEHMDSFLFSGGHLLRSSRVAFRFLCKLMRFSLSYSFVCSEFESAQ